MHPIIDILENLVTHTQNAWEDEAFQKRLHETKIRLSEIVRKNPVGSIGVALLVGFILGKKISRDRKEEDTQ
ncbi:MAG: hypothetical protein WD097_06870 [Balneolales bacterium]